MSNDQISVAVGELIEWLHQKDNDHHQCGRVERRVFSVFAHGAYYRIEARNQNPDLPGRLNYCLVKQETGDVFACDSEGIPVGPPTASVYEPSLWEDWLGAMGPAYDTKGQDKWLTDKDALTGTGALRDSLAGLEIRTRNPDSKPGLEEMPSHKVVDVPIRETLSGTMIGLKSSIGDFAWALVDSILSVLPAPLGSTVVTRSAAIPTVYSTEDVMQALEKKQQIEGNGDDL